MERLLEDATALSGVEYDIENLGDVYDAIHVIQQDLGLTGVAAAEASDTFTGSMGAMKAAAENLMANLALGEDITTPLKVLVGNAKVFLTNNLLPMVGNILKGIPVIIGEVFNNILPELMTEGIEFAKTLGDGLVTGIPEFISKALTFISEMSANMRAQSGQLIDVGLEFLQKVAEGIAAAMPELIATIPQIIMNFTGNINDNLPKIFDAAWNIIKTLAQGLLDSMPVLMESIPQILDAITSTWRAGNLLQIGVDTINDIITGITNSLPELILFAGELVIQFINGILVALPQIINAGVDMLLNLVDGLTSNLGEIHTSVIEIITSFIQTIVANYPTLMAEGITIIAKLVVGLIAAIPKIIAAIPQIIQAIVNAFGSFDWASIGRNILEGIKNGILDAVDMVVDAAKEAAGEIWDSVKDFFDINSPSRLMMWAGEMIDAGLAKGITDNKDMIDSAIDGVNVATASAFNVNPSYDFESDKDDKMDVLLAMLGAYLPEIAEKQGLDVEQLYNGINRQLGWALT